MATAELTIAGRHYRMACRDGDEANLVALAQVVDAKAADAKRAIGDTTEARLLLMASLLLADELQTAGAPPPAPAPATDDRLVALAAALEDIASSLEKRVDNA